MAVLSHEYWQRQARGRPDIVGRTLRVHATTYSRVSIATMLTSRSISAPGRQRFSLATLLVVVQVGLSTALVITAGLFGRSLVNLRAQAIGFDREHVLLVTTTPVQTGRFGPALLTLADDMCARLSMLPGVDAVSVSNGGVLEGGDDRRRSREPRLLLRTWAVAPGFFDTVGVPLVAGRDFEPGTPQPRLWSSSSANAPPASSSAQRTRSAGD